jgi:hypothetical protein
VPVPVSQLGLRGTVLTVATVQSLRHGKPSAKTAFQDHWLIAIAQSTRHRDTPRHSGLKSHLWRDMRAKR